MAQQNSTQNAWANATFTSSYKAPAATPAQQSTLPPPAFNAFANLGTSQFPSMSGLPTTPLFGTTQTQQTTPVFGTTQTQQAPVFGTQNTSTTTQADKNQNQGQVLQCLIETKAINSEILTELKAIAMKLNNAQPTVVQQTKTVHNEVYCNGCGKQNITGARYKCLLCKNYDLCEDCESKPAHPNHDPMHMFVKIKDTASYNHVMSVMREKNINYFSL